MTTAEMVLRGKTDIDEVYEAGKAQRDYEWWDMYYDNLFTSFEYAFSGFGWRDDTYNPKHAIVTTSSCDNMYYYSGVTDTKVTIDLSRASSAATKTFRYSDLVTIRKFIVHEKLYMSTQFTNCYCLENLIIEGTIGTNANFQWCECLTLESMISVITHLKNFTTDDPDKAFTCTVQFDEGCLDNLVENGGLSPNGNSWTDYITDLGWNY